MKMRWSFINFLCFFPSCVFKVQNLFWYQKMMDPVAMINLTMAYCGSKSSDVHCCSNYRHLNGRCKACAPGTYNANCSDECPDGFYGLFCAEKCSCEKYCDKVKGCLNSDSTIPTIPAERWIYWVLPLSLGVISFVGIGFIILGWKKKRTGSRNLIDVETVNYNRGDEETVDDTEHFMTGPYEVELQTVENNVNTISYNKINEEAVGYTGILMTCLGSYEKEIQTAACRTLNLPKYYYEEPVRRKE
ncbi:uncharacterized protein LOC111137945 [Crassostrea virginica]